MVRIMTCGLCRSVHAGFSSEYPATGWFVDDQLDFPRFDFQRTFLGMISPLPMMLIRNNRRARLNGQVKVPCLKALISPSRLLVPSRKVMTDLPFADAQRRQLQALQGLFVVLPVDFDVARAFHGLAEDGNGKQLFLAIQRNCPGTWASVMRMSKIALVVGHQHWWFAPQEVFPADHLHFRSGRSSRIRSRCWPAGWALFSALAKRKRPPPRMKESGNGHAYGDSKTAERIIGIFPLLTPGMLKIYSAFFA